MGAAVAILTLGVGGVAIATQQGQEDIKGGTTAAPAGSGEENEADGKSLERFAEIDRSAAEKAALDAVSGEVRDVELENENGFVVYEVEVAGQDGKLREVVVDAGNGRVLDQEIEAEEGEGLEEPE